MNMAMLQHHGHCTLKEEENRFNKKKKNVTVTAPRT